MFFIFFSHDFLKQKTTEVCRCMQGRRLRFASGRDNYGERSEPKNFLLTGDNPPETAKLTML
jgi:hypothetical protein